MKWPPWKKTEEVGEARKAVADAHQSLRDVQERESAVRDVSKALKDIRERNHFADQLRVIMERR
jgi:hypothetical protein